MARPALNRPAPAIVSVNNIWEVATCKKRRQGGPRLLFIVAIFSSLILLVTLPACFLLVGARGADTNRPMTVLRRAADDSKEAEDLAKEVELLEARAAAARAKAALLEAQARVAAGSAPVEEAAPPAVAAPVFTGGYVAEAAPPAASSLAWRGTIQTVEQAVIFAGERVRRPAELLLSPEGQRVLALLAQLEEIPRGENGTALKQISRDGLGAMMEISAIKNAIKAGGFVDIPQPMKEDILAVSDAVGADPIATFLTQRNVVDGQISGADWRPLAQSFAQVSQLVDRLNNIARWEYLAEALRGSTIGLEEARVAILQFVRGAQARNPGNWDDEEVLAVERLADHDPTLKKIFLTLDTVRKEASDDLQKQFGWIPIVLYVVLPALIFCLCCNFPGGDGGGTGGLDVDPSGLPLLKLQK